MKDIYVIEEEANLFAILLLIPDKFLEEDLATVKCVDYEDDELVTRLAEKYQVSKQLMTIRLARYLEF